MDLMLKPTLADLFARIPSPHPVIRHPTASCPDIDCQVLNSFADDGPPTDVVRTKLYEYQKRSVWKMLDIEIYDDHLTGGILCEVMGAGKTLMIISLISSTLSCLSRPPQGVPWYCRFQNDQEWVINHRGVPNYAGGNNPPSLKHIALTKIATSYRRWTRGLELILPDHLYNELKCGEAYFLHNAEVNPREHRAGSMPLNSINTLYLSSTSLVVVPDTLKSQWMTEFNKHTTGTLKIIPISDDKRIPIPSVDELLESDVVILSHSRLAHEDSKGFKVQGLVPRKCECPYFGATRQRDCRCSRIEPSTVSPLLQIYFLRIIFDEGHLLKHESVCMLSSKLIDKSTNFDDEVSLVLTPYSHVKAKGGKPLDLFWNPASACARSA
jgi:hypothetical protein